MSYPSKKCFDKTPNPDEPNKVEFYLKILMGTYQFNIIYMLLSLAKPKRLKDPVGDNIHIQFRNFQKVLSMPNKLLSISKSCNLSLENQVT